MSLLKYRLGYEIYPGTNIGDLFYIGHFGGLVINSKATIGRNVNVSQGVTIGEVSTGKYKGVPVLEDNVWVGANAVVVGGDCNRGG